MIGGLRDLGKTVFLTTHYMEEAQALADRVAVISEGRIVATGTPDDLGGRGEAPTVISFDATGGAELDGLLDGDWKLEDGRHVLRTTSPVPDLQRLTSRALERGVELPMLEVRRPSLEDVYLELTGGGRDQ